jgi:hypothetical protein
MSYYLGVRGKGITGIRTLGDREYEEYTNAVSCLNQFSSDQQLYVITLLNYDDFFEALKNYDESYAKDPRIINYLMLEKMALNVNRLIINYLSSSRTFLDHTEFKLKRVYGEQSQRYIIFKAATALEYDTNFSYRFFYKLRNYTQHCGMPLGGIKFNSKEEPEFSGNIINTLSIYFAKDRLLEFNKWGTPVEDEINKLPNEFDILPHFKDFRKSLDKLNLVLIESNIADLVQSAQRIQQLLNEAKTQQGTPIIFSWIDEGRVKKMHIQNIPFHLVEYANQLEGTLRKKQAT